MSFQSPMTPRVSIIVPVYNKETYLGACLDSLAAQTLAGIEIICIDDGSTDGSRGILRDAADKNPLIQVVEFHQNQGVSAARNHGMGLATGQYLRFVDADDLLPPGSSELLYDRALATRADLVRGGLSLFLGNDVQHPTFVVQVPDRLTTDLPSAPELWRPWWHTSYLISRQLVLDHDLRYPDLRRGEDPVFLASLLIHAKRISLVPEIVYFYRKYSKATGSGGSTFADVRDSFRHAMIVKDMFQSVHPPCWDEGYGPFLLEDFRKFLARCKLTPAEADFVRAEAALVWGPGNGLSDENGGSGH